MFQFSLPDFAFAFLSILLEGLPFVLLGTLLSGVIDAFLPSRLMNRLLPRNPALAVFVSGGLGLIFPMCECGIVPVIRRLMRKGLPVGCGLAYMLSAPIVNPVVAISTFAAFKGQDAGMVTAFRLGLGYLVAVVVALLASRLAAHHILRAKVMEEIEAEKAEHEPREVCCQEHGGSTRDHHTSQEHAAGCGCKHEHEESHPHGRAKGLTMRGKVGRAVRVASADFLDVSMFLVIGAALAAIFNTAINQAVIIPLAFNVPLGIASLMGLAGILSLCSTSDAFIAATFIAFSTSAKLAFMVFGPMMDLKLVFLYGMVFRKRFVAALAVFLLGLIGLACWRLDAFLL